MSFEIKYHPEVVSVDIPKLPKGEKRRISCAIEEKLMIHPEVFGKPLRRSLFGFRKLRVGDYRVVFEIEKKTVIIYMIEHRSVVYKNAAKRI